MVRTLHDYQDPGIPIKSSTSVPSYSEKGIDDELSDIIAEGTTSNYLIMTNWTIPLISSTVTMKGFITMLLLVEC